MLDNISLFLSKFRHKAHLNTKARLVFVSAGFAALTACGGGGGGGGGGSTSCFIAQPNELLPLSGDFSVTYKAEGSSLPVVVTTATNRRILNRCIAPMQLEISGQKVEEFLESDAQGIRIWGYKIKGYEFPSPLPGQAGKILVDITATLESPFVLYDVDSEKPLGVTGKGEDKRIGQAFLKIEGQNDFSKAILNSNAFKAATQIADINRHPVEFFSGVKLSNGSNVFNLVKSIAVASADPGRESSRDLEFDVAIDLKEFGDKISIPSLNIHSEINLLRGLGIYTRQLDIDSVSARANLTVARINGNDADCDGYLDIVDDDSSDRSSPSTTSNTLFNSACEAIQPKAK